MYMLGVARLCCVASSHVFDLQQEFQLYSIHAHVLRCREGLQMDVENIVTSHSVAETAIVHMKWHLHGPGCEHTFVSYTPLQTFVAPYKLDPNNVRLKLLN